MATEQVRLTADGKKPTKKIGGGALLGAGMGGIMEGGDGAAVGAVVGGVGRHRSRDGIVRQPGRPSVGSVVQFALARTMTVTVLAPGTASTS